MISGAVKNRAEGRAVQPSAGRSARAPWAILGLFVILSLVGTLSARYGAPAASPVGRGTLPPSSYAKAPQTQTTAFGDPSGLVHAPNPMDNANNLVMTGNVSGGKSFRGNLPYNSAASFAGQLGSTSLDPFLRYSALPEDPGQDPSATRPFYSPTATVPQIQPGHSSVFAPGSPRIAVGVMQSQAELAADNLPTPETALFQTSTGRTNVGGNANAGGWQGWGPSPLAKTPEQMRQLVAGEPGPSLIDSGPLPQSKQLMTAEEYQRQMEQVQRDLDRVKTNAFEFEQDFTTGRQPSLQTMPPRPMEAMQSSYSTEALRQIIQPQSPPANPPADQDLPAGVDGAFPSQDQSQSLWTQGGESLSGGIGQTSRLVYGSPAVGQPGQGQGRTGADSPELGLGSLQSPLYGAPASASTDPRFRPYGSAAGLGLSPSDLAAQKRRIDAVFRPQEDPIPMEQAAPGRSEWDLNRAVPSNLFGGDAPAPMNRGRGAGPQPQQNTLAGPGPNTMNPVEEKTLNTVSRVVNPEPALPARQTPPPVPPRVPPAEAPKPVNAVPKPAEAPLGSPPDARSQEKFDQYLALAQTHVQQTQYARAAELFALASVYGPRDARPQLGRCHALLGLGEYLGSAACLAKAIELDPRRTLAKADLIEIVGGPDAFIARITDLEQRAKTGDTPGLQLLLAYIYQQMDRPEEATAAIRIAKKGLPSATSVGLLEAAIGGRM